MWDFEQLEYICVILQRFMCPQLACCLLNTDLGPTVIHTFKPSSVVSTLLVTLLNLYHATLILLLLSTWLFILAPALPCLTLFFSQGLLATFQHQKSDIEMSCPFTSARDIEGEKMRKRHRRAYGSDNKGGQRISEAKSTQDSCCHLDPLD